MVDIQNKYNYITPEIQNMCTQTQNGSAKSIIQFPMLKFFFYILTDTCQIYDIYQQKCI